MNKAKETLGERARRMAPFYYQYGLYMLSKIEKNADIIGGPAQKVINQPNEPG